VKDSSVLEQLREMTVVVADTGDLAAIERFRPRDATTNPSLIVAAAKMPEYQSVVRDSIRDARSHVGGDATDQEVMDECLDHLAVTFGSRILDLIPGRVSTEVDARLSFDVDATVARARTLIARYERLGVARERVLIKIASTWQGIRAAEVLEGEGVTCNLTLLFGIHQAVACAEAKVTLISPFVGRILDWYRKETGRDAYPGPEDPGVLSVTQIYNYYKRFGYQTEVMGASFRNTDQIIELAGCDLLTISPALLESLDTMRAPLERRLSSERALTIPCERIPMDASTFERMHAADRMANEKLSEGIASFSQAALELEAIIRAMENGSVD